ncbi:FkbM family methyltransferase [Vineibacter terrae]|uniref:FkbM family methyltransferase n=1 Tax=Vineibacter terrae TaxID=2586908 RepID=UPI002E307ED9|nr:FkbM family methyltransferase [Vineibacter terrae]HEX2886060.1 FkbM family methyltransferase [Vineibacter terrae]
MIVPGYAHPVWIRPGTSDVAVFERMFLRHALDANSYPQQGRIDDCARELGARAVVIDGGANIGLAAVWFARRYPQAKIMAVEPDPANVVMIRKNAAGYPNIVAVQAGLWDGPASLQIVNPDARPWERKVGEVEQAPTAGAVRSVAVNELLATAGGEPLIVKLIIEGAEKAVFRSNTEWLDRTPLVIYMPGDWAHPWDGAGRTAMAALARQPYDWIVRELCVFCFRDPAADPAAISAPAPTGRG